MSCTSKNSTISFQLPSPPSSPNKKFDNSIRAEKFICNDKYLENVKTILGSPVENTIEISNYDILRSKFMNFNVKYYKIYIYFFLI